MSRSGLLRHSSDARLAPYVRATDGTDRQVEEFYRWNTRLALALFDDIGVVEVALRNVMSSELRKAFGAGWFDDWSLFDDDTMSTIDSAKAQSGFERLRVDDDIKHGKLVASMTFGFWVKLLGEGSFQGVTRKSRAPEKKRMIYDTTLWRACLHLGFAGAGPMERMRVERPAAVVKAIRNRVAHHESVIWGVPLPGQIQADGRPRRLPVGESHRHVVEVAALIDPGLAEWIRGSSAIPELLDCRPPSAAASLRL
jgi:hypothetical protein